MNDLLWVRLHFEGLYLAFCIDSRRISEWTFSKQFIEEKQQEVTDAESGHQAADNAVIGNNIAKMKPTNKMTSRCLLVG